MSVYVDELFDTTPQGGWPFRQACHLFADTPGELHTMARRIGLARRWYQNRENFPHYDLTPSKRALDRWAVFEYSQRFRRDRAEITEDRS